MNRLRIALDRHWFGPASLRELALVRVVLVAAQLVFFLITLALGAAGAKRFPVGQLTVCPTSVRNVFLHWKQSDAASAVV